MSENKNIIIQQNNRIDYDKYHPDNYDSNVKLTGDNITNWRDTLKDALPKINDRVTTVEGNQWEIGDIRVSAKSSLGNKWLKCDGGSYNTSDYPDLAKVTSVQGFPFGTGNLKKITLPGKANFKAVNGDWGDNIQAVKVNEYYIRTADAKIDTKNKKVAFTVYYSTDFENWKSNNIEFQWPDLGGDYNYEELLVGYENRYWYFSFRLDSYISFIYSSDIKSNSWNLVKTTFMCRWSGQLVYYNNQWMFWGYLYNSSDSEYVLTKFYSNSIDFSQATTVLMNHNGINGAWRTDCWSYRNGSVIYQLAENIRSSSSGGYDYQGTLFYSFNINDSYANNYFQLYSSSYAIKQILNKNGKISLYTTRSKYTTIYVVELDGTNISSIPDKNTCYNNTNYPSFVNQSGKYCLYYNSGKSVYISNLSTLNSPSSQTSSAWTSEMTGSVTAFLETDTGVFFIDSSNNFGKLSFGGVLPNYSPESSSTTSLNTFIKALD